MPASPSLKPRTDRRPRLALAVAAALVVALVVTVIVLPASLVAHALPPNVQAQDFSGSLWHGSAGRITVNGRDAGAVEWHLRASSIWRFKLIAQVRWVDVGFVGEGLVAADRRSIEGSDVGGGGPLGDLQALGLAGWRGDLHVDLKQVTLDVSGNSVVPQAAVGVVTVAGLALPQFAQGADLGGYELKFAAGAITPDTDTTGEIADTGGPLDAHGVIHYSAPSRTATLSGTLRERGPLPPALQHEIDSIAQLHARDAQGRIPVDFEFTL